MLNFGLIGEISHLKHYAEKAKSNPSVHLIGKSSVGTRTDPEEYQLSVPEFNRIELIERSDALIINRFTLHPFNQLSNIVKSSKHLFAVTYPDLTISESVDLSKLVDEAATTVQFSSPFGSHPAMLWFIENIKKPAFIEIRFTDKDLSRKDIRLQLLLMLAEITRQSSKKTGAFTYSSVKAESSFTVVRLNYDNGLNVSLQLTEKENQHEFQIRSYANNQFTCLDLINREYLCNDEPVDLSNYNRRSEIESFINSILGRKLPTVGINEYREALQIIEDIDLKLGI